jgi:hypothetical protein
MKFNYWNPENGLWFRELTIIFPFKIVLTLQMFDMTNIEYSIVLNLRDRFFAITCFPFYFDIWRSR